MKKVLFKGKSTSGEWIYGDLKTFIRKDDINKSEFYIKSSNSSFIIPVIPDTIKIIQSNDI